MRVSDAIVDRFRAHGIDTLFGIPGTQTLPLNETIEDTDEVRFVMARHETAVSHMAWGYAETSGGIAATLVVPGPGDMNAMNGLKNAYNDATPLVHVAVETEPHLRGTDAIHETPPDTYDNVVKTNAVVESPSSAPAVVERAIAIARTPPQGPVRIGIPRNFLTEDIGHVETGTYRGETVGEVHAETLDAAAELLRAADAPVVLGGGGVRRSGAGDALRGVAETLDAPMVTTLKGKGTVSEFHDLSAGVVTRWEPWMRELLADSDAALAVGTDLDSVTTDGGDLGLPTELIHVTLDPDDVGRNYDPAVGIVGDADAVLAGLNERLDDSDAGERDGAAAAERVRKGRQERLDELAAREGPMTSPALLEAAREVIPRDAVVTSDGGGLRIWMNPAFDVDDAGRYVQPGSWATMGTALPSAIGAALNGDDREVVTLIGDGGLMMSLHELHTVVDEGLPIVILVANNHGFGIISESATVEFDVETGAYDWDGAPLDFTTIAEGMGMAATRVQSREGVRDALATAIEADEPMLVEAAAAPHEPQAFHWLTDE
jgi:acetolactate synthase-1/2/3 large subunit